jgi:ligand-binding sensor domain-containing protein
MRAGLSDSTVKEVQFSGHTDVVQYVLVVDRGVYRRTDSDVTWLAVNGGLPADGWGRVNVHEIAVDAGDPSFVYAGRRDLGRGDSTLSSGLYWTDDGGDTWLVSGQALAGKQVQSIAMVPSLGRSHSSEEGASQLAYGQNNAAGIVYVATNGEVFRSTNRGGSWEPLHWRGVETTISSLAIHPGDPDVLYVGTQGSGLYATDNGGSSWKAMNEGLEDLNVHDIAIVTADSRKMYLATDVGAYRSTDAGSTWAKLGGPLSARRVETIAVLPGGGDFLCVGMQHGGVCCSMDGGAQWTALKRGLGNLTVLTLTLDPRDAAILWAGTTDGIWRYAFGTPMPSAPPPASPAPPSPTGTPLPR